MSMLRHMRDTEADMPVTFLYANRNEEDILFRRELDDMEAGGRPRLRMVHVLSQAGPAWPGERGHLNEGMIRRHCGEAWAGKSFYVCGPAGLVGAILHALKHLGAPDERIRRERFSFLD